MNSFFLTQNLYLHKLHYSRDSP